jgi:anti-sigma factor ChrR (cupin superfamily)
MSTDDSQDRLEPSLAAALAAALAPAEFSSVRRARLRERVLASAKPSLMHVVRAQEGQWLSLLPGVAIKFLHIDPARATQSSLWRLDAGASLPSHGHAADEECIVLEGTVRYADSDYGRGDFLLARAGLQHEHFETLGGTTLYIRGELSAPLAGLARKAGLLA